MILDIDSPGGMTSEAERIINVIRKYNQELRLIAYTDKTLSAAAVLTLSVHEIYLKPSGIIGAATAYKSRGWLPPQLDEKLESVWRATARSSAETGGHEPLLAEAMIDNDLELHLETVNGKKVVKAGAGEETLCRKGKVLTLTAQEAITCGLANGVADDYPALGKALGYTGWMECKGLGTLLADYWPKRDMAFETEMKKIGVRLERDMGEALRLAPTGNLFPGQSPPSQGSAAQSQEEWNQRSLFCVLALRRAEQDFRDAMALVDAFPEHAVVAEKFKDALLAINTTRQSVYDARDQFVAVFPGTANPNSPASAVPRLGRLRPGLPGRAGLGPVAPGASPAPAPSPASTDIPADAVKTAMVGSAGGRLFVNVSPAKSPVIGFQVTLANWQNHLVLRHVEPLYEKPASQAFGSYMPLAKEGYVVGGLIVNGDRYSRAMCIIFVRMKDGQVNAQDTYTSDWFGDRQSESETQLAGRGETVIGIYGKQGINLDGIGLVLAGAAPAPGK